VANRVGDGGKEGRRRRVEYCQQIDNGSMNKLNKFGVTVNGSQIYKVEDVHYTKKT
jgi:hypothetical protein|tara:strand:- start:67 stop:234 length:168 start_codon:yes stop_codon:yes gene_type:complete